MARLTILCEMRSRCGSIAGVNMPESVGESRFWVVAMRLLKLAVPPFARPLGAVLQSGHRPPQLWTDLENGWDGVTPQVDALNHLQV